MKSIKLWRKIMNTTNLKLYSKLILTTVTCTDGVVEVRNIHLWDAMRRKTYFAIRMTSILTCRINLAQSDEDVYGDNEDNAGTSLFMNLAILCIGWALTGFKLYKSIFWRASS